MAISVESILRLPLPKKIAILGVVIVLLGAIFYFNLYSPKREELESLQVRLEEARRKLEESR